MKNPDHIHSSIKQKITRDLETKLNKEELEHFWPRFGTSDTFLKSITLTPFHVYECLKQKKSVSIKTLKHLGYINLKACIAYTIYDYIHDCKFESDYTSKFLSIANIYIQDCIFELNKICTEKDFLKSTKELFNCIDTYYLKPISTNLKNVYEKSIGLSIIPLLTLHIAGFKEKTSLYLSMYDLFKNYLNARQLSDDFDDIERDIQNQHITPAVLLYKEYKDLTHVKSLLRKQIDSNMKKVRTIFKGITSFAGQKFIDGYIREC